MTAPTGVDEHVPSGHMQHTATYRVRVDPLQGDRAIELHLASCARPHMRAFHFAWLSFFFAFFGWFSIPPLMPTIKAQLGLTKDEVANTNIAAVASTIVGRVIIGPLCDCYGPRTIQAVLLVFGALPVAAASLVTSYTGLVVVRFAIGLVGCAFVATTYWTSVIFAQEIVGVANALAAGWGNLGAGVTYLITPFIFDLVTWNGGVSDNWGWRITLLIPALFMVVIGVALYRFSDDCPQGNYNALRQTRQETSVPDLCKPQNVDMSTALLAVCRLPSTWILAFQYACSFGIELQVHNELSLYYYEDFRRPACDPQVASDKCRQLTQTTGSLISSLFGLMCIFARALGGFLSDVACRRWKMRGRIITQFIAFTGQALSLFIYSRMHSVASSVPCLVVFGVFVQACTGTTFGIVPYVSPRYTGATSGIVGAGGNIGALCWGFLFKGVGNRASSFEHLSLFVAGAGLLCWCIHIDGEGSGHTPENLARQGPQADFALTQPLVDQGVRHRNLDDDDVKMNSSSETRAVVTV